MTSLTRIHVTADAAQHAPRRKLLVHVSGGGRIGLTMDVRGLDDVGDRLRRERALIGQMTVSDEHGEHVCEVLIPSSRVHFVVDADD